LFASVWRVLELRRFSISQNFPAYSLEFTK
jgi:hypothetical protein